MKEDECDFTITLNEEILEKIHLKDYRRVLVRKISFKDFEVSPAYITINQDGKVNAAQFHSELPAVKYFDIEIKVK